LVQIPYNSSTKAMLRLRRRKRKRFLEFLSEKISLQSSIHFSMKQESNASTRIKCNINLNTIPGKPEMFYRLKDLGLSSFSELYMSFLRYHTVNF